jgi:hypothetical protein
MPAYAKDGKVVCYFTSADKFKSRYATFGFNDTANLDEGALWLTSFALKELRTDLATGSLPRRDRRSGRGIPALAALNICFVLDR